MALPVVSESSSTMTMTTPATRASRKREERSNQKASSDARGAEAPKSSWGGARPGAGRPPGSGRRNTPHVTRPVHDEQHPVHVTVRFAVRSLRSEFLFPTVRGAIMRTNHVQRGSFRICHFSVQTDHLHLLVEATDRRSLQRGMHSLTARLASWINRLLMCTGNVVADRWYGRALETPLGVRRALVYLLGNYHKHGRPATLSSSLHASKHIRPSTAVASNVLDAGELTNGQSQPCNDSRASSDRQLLPSGHSHASNDQQLTPSPSSNPRASNNQQLLPSTDLRSFVDVFSSAPYFDGFREFGSPADRLRLKSLIPAALMPPTALPVEPGQTWLLRTAWRAIGLISINEYPSRTVTR